MNDLTFPEYESVLGVWAKSDEGRMFVVRCHLCKTTLWGGYEEAMVNNVGVDAAEEWVEHQIKRQWNQESPCNHIKFDISVGVHLQDVWVEWAGKGTTGTTGTSQGRLDI